MKRIENLGGKACSAALALLITAGAAWGTWRDAQPKFHDMTISAGESVPQISAFLTGYAAAGKAAFVTDPASIDCNAVGEQPVTLKHGQREETVTLTIRDTLAPELTLHDRNASGLDVLKPEDFVTEVWDHSTVTLRFAAEPVIPEDYSDLTLTIIAADAHGNETSAQCTASFAWLKDAVTLELGQTLTREDLLYSPEKDAHLISDADLDLLNTAPIGAYTISSTAGGKTLECQVTIQDTQGPVLQLQEHQVYLYGSVRMEDFIVSATDASGEVILRMLTEPDCYTEGVQTIVIEAEDVHGNITTAQTMLYVATDVSAPVISGAGEAMTVEKYAAPDFLAGVTAQDARDGEVEVTVDAGMVDTSVAGDYYITYTARDSSGNVATHRRKVTVLHNEEDTLALVQSIAAQLEDDPEKIRDYIRSSIYYSTNWGGEDPVWYGFTNKYGNCYVHALCLKAVLDEKGYNTQLIWVVDKTHYWLIIEMEPGVWRHIDATPSDLHSRYSLMTDEQRIWTLSGRDWDHSQWPACE